MKHIEIIAKARQKGIFIIMCLFVTSSQLGSSKDGIIKISCLPLPGSYSLAIYQPFSSTLLSISTQKCL